jgi:ankyrin repeat protein
MSMYRFIILFETFIHYLFFLKKDIHGNTSLHKASTHGHKDVAEILVERGANLRIRNDYDRTPLDEAKTPQMRKLLEGILCKNN